DLERLRTHKEKVIGKLTSGLAGMAKARKVQVVQGVGRFLDPRHIEVVAADEELLRVEDDPFALTRCAYHLGNRHVRIQITAEYLQFRADPVLAEMVRQLGVHPAAVVAAFEPEWGAYGGGHQHGHDATFPEDYALAQAAFAARSTG
ncbi:MAG: hypothetical protein ACO3DD_03900, partial [Burkholderiaceae bacterium]